VLVSPALPPLASPPPQGGTQSGTALWTPYLGASEDTDYPVTRAAREAFQHRGVLGTYSHRHPAGTAVLPVIRVFLDRTDARTGRPGRKDAAWLVDASPASLDDLAWPVEVHRAYIPRQHLVTPWNFQDPPGAGGAYIENEFGLQLTCMYVGFEDAAPVPVAGDETLVTANHFRLDVREVPRLVMYPSGELPRIVDRITVGSSIQGGEIPSATIDEVVLAAEDPDRAHQNVLELAFGVGANQLDLDSGIARLVGEGILAGASIGTWPEDAGLLLVGDEVVCYESRDESSGIVTIAPGGRGLLGTAEQHHQPGEAVLFLRHWPVTLLNADVSGMDATLPVVDLTDLGQEGTVRIADELLHFTRTRAGALEMPAASLEPGAMDRRGGGIFRGRYGTSPAGHVAGTPVIQFPFRYWDRGAARADAPELSYMGFTIHQPNAFWRGVFWEEEAHPVGGAGFRVLQRTDASVPWDAEPSASGPLRLYRRGMPEGDSNPIGLQSDRIEWRVFLEHDAGSFDPINGGSHAWKTTPRLKLFGVQYLAPEVVVRGVDL